MLKEAKLVDVEFRNTTLKEAMEQCFAGQPLMYTIRNNTVIVKRKPLSRSGHQVINTKQNKIENQPTAIGGQVTDAVGEPLIGVSVTVKGSTTGTITDRKSTRLNSSH